MQPGLVRNELAAGSLKPVALREGGERYAELYLVLADPEHAGPATRRLAEIIRERVGSECKRAASGPASKSAARASVVAGGRAREQ